MISTTQGAGIVNVTFAIASHLQSLASHIDEQRQKDVQML